MNKKINNGLAIILPNKRINLFAIFILILGIISGSIFLIVLKDNDKNMIVEQFNTFIKNVNENNINNSYAFIGVFRCISYFKIFFILAN